MCVFAPIVGVTFGQVFVPNHKQIFGVLLLGGLREVEWTRNDGFPVDHHDSVVRNLADTDWF
jgi:hypothetical protein